MRLAHFSSCCLFVGVLFVVEFFFLFVVSFFIGGTKAPEAIGVLEQFVAGVRLVVYRVLVKRTLFGVLRLEFEYKTFGWKYWFVQHLKGIKFDGQLGTA